MGRPSWANDEQTEWLWDRHDAFLTARRDADSDSDTLGDFMTKTCQLFFDEFPLCADPVEPSADGTVPTKEERVGKREHVSFITSHVDAAVLTINPANILVVLEPPLQEEQRQEGGVRQPFPRACSETPASEAAISGIHAPV